MSTNNNTVKEEIALITVLLLIFSYFILIYITNYNKETQLFKNIVEN